MTSSAGSAADLKLDPERIAWTALSYRARKLTVTATSRVSLTRQPAAVAASGWLLPSEGRPIEPLGSDVVRIELDSHILGKRSSLELWVEPETAAAFQRVQLETGKKTRHNRHRSLRFTDRGVFNATFRADEESVDQPFTEWPLTEVFEPYPMPVEKASTVLEPSGLFYFLAVADLETRADARRLLVFSKGRLLEVRVVSEGRRTLRVEYTRVSNGRSLEVEGEQETLHLRLSGRPISGEGDEKSFEFLGLRGEVELFLDPEYRFPVEIRGNIRYAGKGRVRLERVELAGAGHQRLQDCK